MECIFCKIVNKEIPSNVIYSDDLVEVIMDINPLVDGHVLVIPKKHYTDYFELEENIASHIFKVAQDLGPKIMQKLDKKSITLLVNYGDDQQVKHFHLHLLPDLGTTDKSRATKSVLETFNEISKEN